MGERKQSMTTMVDANAIAGKSSNFGCRPMT
jgi:hypothetical protein